MRVHTALLATSLFFGLSAFAGAQEEGEPSITVNGHMKLQSGVFLPLLSDMFQEHDNQAMKLDANDNPVGPCDPVETPNVPCYPREHGQEAGSLSMFRATLQLEGEWTPDPAVTVHAVLRGVRSLMVDADGWAQMPRPSTSTDPDRRRQEAMEFVHRNYYTEFELREFYLDVYPADWLSFRLGRQQVTWGETGQYRLLDVVNPIDSTWHFGPLESFEDTRIPLWIVKGLIEFPSIDHSLELVWVPGIDRPRDMITVPLTLVGAWGLPYPDTPSPFIIDEKVFLYPKNSIDDTMRIGFRWKGELSTSMTYSLVYYYTHQLSPPIPLYFDHLRLEDGSISSNHLEKLFLGFPRQHIAGFSFDFTLEHPIGAVVRLEAAIEPDRTFPRASTTGRKRVDDQMPWRGHFEQPKYMAMSYALVFMRPTMIRFLNPTQNFMIVAQFMHTMVPGLSSLDAADLVEIPGYNNFKVEKHSMRVILAITTNYLRGFLSPKLVGVYALPDSGFVSASLDFRLGVFWRLNLTVTDFFGKDPYKGVGLFRDRDEINFSLMCQF